MELKERIESFASLGDIVKNALKDENCAEGVKLKYIIDNEHLSNEWFTPDNVRMSLNAAAEVLTTEKLSTWCSAYPALNNSVSPNNIGVVMAGNIPMVGFHDLLSVLVSGNRIIVKASTKDNRLIIHLTELLCSINPEFTNYIKISADVLSGFDAVIATGSDNSARYFEYYFGKYPHIIRKNRNSVGIISGEETSEDLMLFGKDIFSYFGLGCRNVSKVYLPQGYDINMLTEKWVNYSSVINHTKYGNNYDFNKAVYIVNKEKFHDNGFILCREEKKIASPVSVLYYDYYTSQNELEENLTFQKEKIQCIVGKKHVPFGRAQFPELWDYADGNDTLEFLLKKNKAGIL